MDAKQLDIPVHSEGTSVPSRPRSSPWIRRAREARNDVVLLDTAGRLQISDR